jgi:hypothetical protein
LPLHQQLKPHCCHPHQLPHQHCQVQAQPAPAPLVLMQQVLLLLLLRKLTPLLLLYHVLVALQW